MNFNEPPTTTSTTPPVVVKEPYVDEEKSFDIELLLREQQQQKQSSLKQDDKQKTLTELSPVKMSSYDEEIKSLTKENSFITYDDSNCSTSTQSTSTSTSMRGGIKRKLNGSPGPIPNLDLTMAKTPLGTNNSEPPVKQVKRGRKPLNAASMSNEPGVKSKYSKEEHDSKTLVYFGNKKVEKDTDEYKVRRSSNNEAVKRCREKAEREQKEREGKMKTLQDENSKLTDKVSSLSKEVDVLKSIIITMRSDKQLPNDIQKRLNELNQTWSDLQQS